MWARQHQVPLERPHGAQWTGHYYSFIQLKFYSNLQNIGRIIHSLKPGRKVGLLSQGFSV